VSEDAGRKGGLGLAFGRGKVFGVALLELLMLFFDELHVPHCNLLLFL
jgi:hypothetical protein